MGVRKLNDAAVLSLNQLHYLMLKMRRNLFFQRLIIDRFDGVFDDIFKTENVRFRNQVVDQLNQLLLRFSNFSATVASVMQFMSCVKHFF